MSIAFHCDRCDKTLGKAAGDNPRKPEVGFEAGGFSLFLIARMADNWESALLCMDCQVELMKIVVTEYMKYK